MALPSSFTSSSSWRFNGFLSFHWPDVRVTFLCNLREQFERNGIVMFNDQEIERSQTIKPELTRAIQESGISIVLLSQNYASSSLCLNELVEILKCKETAGQIVMTVFYEVDPYDVRKQTGEFGKAFKETCERKTETEIQSWTKALYYVATIEGEHSLNWVNEADMSEKIATNVSNKLNATPSRVFQQGCGVSLWTGEIKRSCEFESSKTFANKFDTSGRKDGLICEENENRNVEAKKHIDCFSLLLFCLENSDIVISIAGLICDAVGKA